MLSVLSGALPPLDAGWPEAIVAAPPPGSRTVTVGRQAGIDRTGALVSADIVDQLRQALFNLSAQLAAAGAGPAHLTRMTWLVTDIAACRARWREIDLAYREALGGNLPVLSIVAVAGLARPDAAIEVSAEAVVPPADSAPVYRGMPAAALNRAYSARAAVPDHPRIFAEWRRRGAAFRNEWPRKALDVAYGPLPHQIFDLYLPKDAVRPLPLHVFIHGGYWQAMDKLDHAHLAGGPLAHGMATAVVNYGLCPAVTLDAIVAEIRAAIACLWRQAPEWDLGQQPIQVSGHSAGAHLAAMAAATDWSAAGPDLPRDLVGSALLVSGLFDLEPLRLTAMNRALRLDAEAARRLSPALLAPHRPIPLAVAVGGTESEEFQRQTAELAAAWAAKGCPVATVPMPGTHHFSVIESLATGDGALALAAQRLRGL